MSRKTLKILLGSILAIVVGLILALVSGFVVGYFFSGDADVMAMLRDQAAPVALVLLAVGSMVAALWIGVLWMRSIDEAAREAHKSALFWGGSAGGALGGAAVILSFLPQSADWVPPITFFGRQDPAAYAATGAYAMLLLILAGYGAAWVWWWLARR